MGTSVLRQVMQGHCVPKIREGQAESKSAGQTITCLLQWVKRKRGGARMRICLWEGAGSECACMCACVRGCVCAPMYGYVHVCEMVRLCVRRVCMCTHVYERAVHVYSYVCACVHGGACASET